MGKLVNISEEQRLYAIESESTYVKSGRKTTYVSCLGFDVAYERALRYWLWLVRGRGMELDQVGKLDVIDIGTEQGFKQYEDLHQQVIKYCNANKTRCFAELKECLVGRIGDRVEVEEQDGSKRRFYVGISTGIIPIHLEISRSNSLGGIPIMGHPGKLYKSVLLMGSRGSKRKDYNIDVTTDCNQQANAFHNWLFNYHKTERYGRIN